ncbi:hypothetical protein EBX93_16685, partial [bacterium]|nr:hypothetical protein [bacterium]
EYNGRFVFKIDDVRKEYPYNNYKIHQVEYSPIDIIDALFTYKIALLALIKLGRKFYTYLDKTYMEISADDVLCSRVYIINGKHQSVNCRTGQNSLYIPRYSQPSNAMSVSSCTILNINKKYTEIEIYVKVNKVNVISIRYNSTYHYFIINDYDPRPIISEIMMDDACLSMLNTTGYFNYSYDDIEIKAIDQQDDKHSDKQIRQSLISNSFNRKPLGQLQLANDNSNDNSITDLYYQLYSINGEFIAVNELGLEIKVDYKDKANAIKVIGCEKAEIRIFNAENGVCVLSCDDRMIREVATYNPIKRMFICCSYDPRVVLPVINNCKVVKDYLNNLHNDRSNEEDVIEITNMSSLIDDNDIDDIDIDDNDIDDIDIDDIDDIDNDLDDNNIDSNDIDSNDGLDSNDINEFDSNNIDEPPYDSPIQRSRATLIKRIRRIASYNIDSNEIKELPQIVAYTKEEY